jgi:hypothetical protein
MPVILATQEDQEDCGSKTAPSKQFMRPYLKKPITMKGLVEWLKV